MTVTQAIMDVGWKDHTRPYYNRGEPSKQGLVMYVRFAERSYVVSHDACRGGEFPVWLGRASTAPQDEVVPSVVKYLPELPVWLGAKALKALLAEVDPVPPLATARMPVMLAEVPVTLPAIGDEKVFVPAIVWLLVRSAYKVEPVMRVHVPACLNQIVSGVVLVWIYN